jgi:hypothetical protein
MALVSGPGRGGGEARLGLPEELSLFVDKHVKYIQTLDTVRSIYLLFIYSERGVVPHQPEHPAWSDVFRCGSLCVGF